MPKLKKKKTASHIESNIRKAFEVIDAYLPKTYSSRVQEILPGVSQIHIRHVRCKRQGPTKIVMALKKVALEEKEILS